MIKKQFDKKRKKPKPIKKQLDKKNKKPKPIKNSLIRKTPDCPGLSHPGKHNLIILQYIPIGVR